MIDLTSCTKLPNKFLGSEVKITIIYENRVYMVKFPDPVREKNNSLSYMNNTFSEDIGCKIYKALGFETQNTFLATYHMNDGSKKIVVACEDFTQDGQMLFEFSKLSLQEIESPMPKSPRTQANIDNILRIIDNTPQITNKQVVISRLWDMFIVDGYIKNKDRNLDNWGMLMQNDGSLHFAPIYDCGSSLSALMSDEKMKAIMSNENHFKREEYNVYSCLRVNRNKVLFSDAMNDPSDDLAKAILRLVPKIEQKIPEINNIIDATPVISDTYKTYLKKGLDLRYRQIITPALKKQQRLLMGRVQNNKRNIRGGR